MRVLYKSLFQVYALALFRRNLLWKKIWTLSPDLSANIGRMKERRGS